MDIHYIIHLTCAIHPFTKCPWCSPLGTAFFWLPRRGVHWDLWPVAVGTWGCCKSLAPWPGHGLWKQCPKQWETMEPQYGILTYIYIYMDIYIYVYLWIDVWIYGYMMIYGYMDRQSTWHMDLYHNHMAEYGFADSKYSESLLNDPFKVHQWKQWIPLDLMTEIS